MMMKTRSQARNASETHTSQNARSPAKKDNSHYIRNGCRWTAGEDRILEEAYEKNRKFEHTDYMKLSTYLHRSIDAIQIRLVGKHIYPKKISIELCSRAKYNDILHKYSKRYDIPLEDLDTYLKYADRGLKVRRELFPSPAPAPAVLDILIQSSDSSDDNDSDSSDASYVPDTDSSSNSDDDSDDVDEDPTYNQILKYLETIDRKLDLLLFKRKKYNGKK